MSGGHTHSHPGDCGEVLAKLYLFIDHEIDDASYEEIGNHLDECGPCLHQHELDMLVRQLVARSCHEPAPAPLRERVLLSIREVVTIEVTETHFSHEGPLGGEGTVRPF